MMSSLRLFRREVFLAMLSQALGAVLCKSGNGLGRERFSRPWTARRRSTQVT